MLRLRMLPNFKLADGDGRERPFDDFLADFNVILVTHTRESCRSSTDELLRSFLAEGRGIAGVSVHGIDISSHDVFCKTCCGPHVVFQGREFITICDSGGWIRRLWGVESDAWILIVSAGRNVLDDGPLVEIERLAMQFNLDVALSPHRVARAPPVGMLATGKTRPHDDLAATAPAAVRLSDLRADRPSRRFRFA